MPSSWAHPPWLAGQDGRPGLCRVDAFDAAKTSGFLTTHLRPCAHTIMRSLSGTPVRGRRPRLTRAGAWRRPDTCSRGGTPAQTTPSVAHAPRMAITPTPKFNRSASPDDSSPRDVVTSATQRARARTPDPVFRRRPGATRWVRGVESPTTPSTPSVSPTRAKHVGCGDGGSIAPTRRKSEVRTPQAPLGLRPWSSSRCHRTEHRVR